VVYRCGQEVWARVALDAVAASWHGCAPCGESRREAGASTTGFPSWSLGTSGMTLSFCIGRNYARPALLLVYGFYRAFEVRRNNSSRAAIEIVQISLCVIV